jgi:hypothetical protein
MNRCTTNQIGDRMKNDLFMSHPPILHETGLTVIMLDGNISKQMFILLISVMDVKQSSVKLFDVADKLGLVELFRRVDMTKTIGQHYSLFIRAYTIRMVIGQI